MGFADARGDLWQRTKFSFSVRRDRGFSAGEYTLTVKRTSDGAIMGRPMNITLNGQNELIDRRSIVFAGEKKKDKPKADKGDEKKDDKADGNDTEGSGAADETKDSVPEDVEPPDDPVGEADGPPPVEKRPNGTGCGCRTAGLGSEHGAASLLGLLVFGLIGWRRSRR